MKAARAPGLDGPVSSSDPSRLVLAFEAHLLEHLPSIDQEPVAVHRAMRYSVEGPGKRLRPLVTLAVGELFGAPAAELWDLAVAVELLHASSLVLDDLPAMDDARSRRGRAATHVAFGEDVALLAAYALVAEAFAITSAVEERLRLTGWTRGGLITRLAAAMGSSGLVGGQAMDLETRREPHSREHRQAEIDGRKTAALFVLAAELAALCADVGADVHAAITAYARELGLAFQVADDLLDAIEREDEASGDDSAYRQASVERLHAHLDTSLAALSSIAPQPGLLHGIVARVRAAATSALSLASTTAKRDRHANDCSA